MIRTLYVVLAALFAAIIIHIITILAVPNMAVNDVWHRNVRTASLGQLHIIKTAKDVLDDFPELDPAFAYAMCRVDVSNVPAQLTGSLDSGFWSLAYFDVKNRVQFSLTNQISGRDVQVVLANKVQQRLLSERRDLVDDTAVVITAKEDQGLLVLRAFVEQETERNAIARSLSKLDCSPLWESQVEQ
ncbi:MAG TPA: hypothetical protein DCS30_18880 [Rhizobiales bacterium]|nr:hypothetical protein [Hyphomicrobiales bacterium]